MWEMSDRYFAADEIRMQKFKSASGISLVICGQHKGRTHCFAHAELTVVDATRLNSSFHSSGKEEYFSYKALGSFQ